MRTFCLLFAFLLLLSSMPLAAHDYKLLARAPLQELKPLSFSTTEQAWLLHKQQLVMGIFRYDLPPFGMSNPIGEYEGLSADYAAIVEHQLGLPLRVEMFETREQAWNALAEGKIDFLPSVSLFNSHGNFVLTKPYATEKPILAIERVDGLPLPDDLAGVSVAMVRDYLPLEEVQGFYPKANFRLYDNFQDALNAVNFGQARAFLGNRYALNRNLLSDLNITRFNSIPTKEISFALSRRNPQLLALMNKALDSVSEYESLELLRQWRPDLSSFDYWNQPLQFTLAERAWMKAHPIVKVALYSGNMTAPISFIDGNGILRGMVGDLLTVVGVQTGMRFSFEAVDTTSEMMKLVNTSAVDMITTLSSSVKRDKQILLTRPYLRTPYALVVRGDRNDIRALPDLRGKTLAILEGSAVEDMLRKRYPEINILELENGQEMLQSVLDGKADAATNVLSMAEYQIKTTYGSKLKIVGTLHDHPVWLAFAIGRADPELRDVLNKVLLSIPPVELENMANRWRPSDLVVVDTTWTRFRPVIFTCAIGGGIMMILLASWAYYLRLVIRRKAALRRQLNDQLGQLESLVTSMPFPVSLRDREGRLTYCNERYLIETGVAYEEALGKTIKEHPGLRTTEQAAFYHHQMMEVIASNKPIFEDRRYDLWDNPNSSIGITVYQWIQPYHNSKGEVIGIIGGWLDISEREALFAELREAKQRAEDSNRAKSVFLSTMSHEIRTPMNAIIGMLDMALKKGRRDEHDLQALEVAYESAESLVGLIGDILDLSRIEGGHLEYHPEPVHLGKLIDNLMKVFQGLALDKNISLTKHFPSEPLIRVMVDPLRIKQVLSNLLSNAIKFTDLGGVTLTLHQTHDEATDMVHYRIEVQDSGIGIDPVQQLNLFRPFSQAENRRSGTGLGLYISRSICENMGGTLTLSSDKGAGTCASATMTLPRVREENSTIEEEVECEQEKKLPAMRILVVDDNAANRLLLARQLSWLGQEAEVAEDGYQALDLWQKQTFDIIITDCNMPNLNGYQLTRILRESEEELNRKRAWIIGFTASAMHEVMQRCLEAGMDSCLFKPCSITSLTRALHLHQSGDELPPLIQESKEVEMQKADREMEATMIELMVTTLQEDLTKMKRLRLPKDKFKIADLAHRITGSVRIARQNALAEACLQLEADCRNESLNSEMLDSMLRDLIIRLEHYLTRLHSAKKLADVSEEHL
ncbi:ATP-binding protein [Pantoea sp. NPDC088449]|uniref:ATP-binding protein n=1 Tax=Pantoea sp. NPDC088449 TaxID=3364392 RepID=UPI003809709E